MQNDNEHIITVFRRSLELETDIDTVRNTLHSAMAKLVNRGLGKNNICRKMLH